MRASSQFSAREKAALDHATVEDFKTYWNQAIDAEARFEDDHVTGCGLRARQYQETSASAMGFIDGFNPIIQAVQNFAAPYGGVALGAISFLFAVSAGRAGV